MGVAGLGGIHGFSRACFVSEISVVVFFFLLLFVLFCFVFFGLFYEKYIFSLRLSFLFNPKRFDVSEGEYLSM